MDLYICNSYYHLYISFVKALISDKKSEIMINIEPYDNTLNCQLLFEKIEKSKVFESLIVIDFSKYNFHQNGLLKNVINRIAWIKNLDAEISLSFEGYKNIFIFNDTTSMGRYLNEHNVQYILLEDGMDCYKHLFIYPESKIEKFIKKILKIDTPQMGKSHLIKYIEVNDSDGVSIRKQNIKVAPKKDMVKRLSEANRKLICSVFIDEKIIQEGGCTLLLTQPLSEDNIVTSEYIKICVYKALVEEFCTENEKIVIKPHPRDKTDYAKYFSDACIMISNFPSEILVLSGEHNITRVITIESTAINSFAYLEDEKRIQVGMDWLKKVIDKISIVEKSN